MGNPKIIKVFLNSTKFGPSIADEFGNTALHHPVMGRKVEFLHPHLIDFVGCDHVASSRLKNSVLTSKRLANPHETSAERRKSVELTDEYNLRKKAINNLLQAGIGVWKQNNRNEAANPHLSASEEFEGWWYEVEAQELQRELEKLNSAAEAISVTAALVATASYVGPLQPPLGYGGNSSTAEAEILSVRIFIVCDTLSFYLALVAIMLALMLSLPTSQESLKIQLRRARVLVAVAVSHLFPSIVCVLMAFAASSIAVTPEHGHHGLTMSTTVLGGCLCFVVILLFGKRLQNVWRYVDLSKLI